MRRTTRSVVIAVATAAAVVAVTTPPGTAAPQSEGRQARGGVEVEIPGPENGERAGSGHVRVWPREERAGRQAGLSASGRAADGRVSKLVDNGPTADRLDIVVIGDGYTAAGLDQFHQDALRKWQEISAVEPYATYRGLFNVWAVDAVSRESGVSGDPGANSVRDTALGAFFWCEGIERLLCIDQEKTDGYIAKAPEADLVLVLANSAKYGGAGYNEPSAELGYEGIATASAGHESSGQVAVHETGHSLGKLADEYFYLGSADYEQYPGGAPAERNLSTLTAQELAVRKAKWFRWLGVPSPDGGTVGAYEGAGYYVRGLYRPTENSLMRALGKPFNLPGTEAMIAGFYRHAKPVTARTPTSRPLQGWHTARVDVTRLVGAHAVQPAVRWYLDGKELSYLAGRTRVSVAQLPLRWFDRRTHRLTVRVEDRTPSVRDPKLADGLRASVTWRVRLWG
ncbi:M64 family metallopeptidase [Streptomyces sp. NPDC006879]|uniref:M64 family metallopeptidase n=1 Tax=Streptomyces sp. NPDC006879 TaxID=3364767 RepID=UPI0036CB7247